MNVLFVCLGNICRSPLARGIFRHKATLVGLSANSDSAGFEAYHLGGPADPRSVAVAAKHGIDITDHVARKFSTGDFDRFDLIYVMDEYNYQDVMSLARNSSDRSKVDYLLNLSAPGSDHAVPDPYYGGRNGFEHIFKLMEEACDRLVEELSAGHGRKEAK